MPIPTIGIRYTQTSTLDWTEGVTCRRCGHAVQARVGSTGTGYGKAVYGFGREDAKERAGLGAFEEAVDLARDTIQLARCPRCERRYGGLFWLGIKIGFAWVCVALAVYGMAWAALGGSEASTSGMRASMVLVWGSAIALAVYSFKRKLKAVDQSVRLEPVLLVPDAPAAPAAVSRAAAARPRSEDDLLDHSDHSHGRSQDQEPAQASSEAGLELDFDRSWSRSK